VYTLQVLIAESAEALLAKGIPMCRSIQLHVDDLRQCVCTIVVDANNDVGLEAKKEIIGRYNDVLTTYICGLRSTKESFLVVALKLSRAAALAKK
jgi:hypothetical protein